ncbi:MAG: class II glutamine amidotransferase [Motilibacteraceae bacterium]
MCRLLAVVSTDPAPLSATLHDVLPAFAALSSFHQDGWGVAARGASADEVRVAKAPERAGLDGGFGQAVEAMTTDAGLLHLRWASGDLEVCQGNTHPFVHDGVAFAHNGSAEPVDAIWDLVAPDLRPGVEGSGVEGTTDSEAYFRAVLTALRSMDPAEALITTAAELRARTTISGLNAMLLTQGALYAFADHDPQSAPSLKHGPDYFPIRYRREPGSVVVSSTGYEQSEPAWAALPQQHVLRVERGTLATSVVGAAGEVAA